MGKKYPKRKEVELDSYFKDSEDKFESQFNDELEDFGVEADDIGEMNEILIKDLEELSEGKDILLKEIKELPNGEDRTRAIGDLKEIEAIMYARRRYERKKDQMSEDLRLKQEEMNNDLELKKAEMEREFEFKQKELEQEREKIEKELALKKEEMAQNREMHEEEIKVQKRGTIFSFLGNLLLTGLTLGAYNFMLDKQNKFESGDNYSTSGSRGLTNNIAQIPRTFGKR